MWGNPLELMTLECSGLLPEDGRAKKFTAYLQPCAEKSGKTFYAATVEFRSVPSTPPPNLTYNRLNSDRFWIRTKDCCETSSALSWACRSEIAEAMSVSRTELSVVLICSAAASCCS